MLSLIYVLLSTKYIFGYLQCSFFQFLANYIKYMLYTDLVIENGRRLGESQTLCEFRFWKGPIL